MRDLFILLVVYQAEHFLCDFILQSHHFFTGKFRKDWSFIGPLAVHCAVHAIFTFGITFWWTTAPDLALLLAALDFTIHFGMDRLKASPRWLGRWQSLTKSQYTDVRNYLASPQESFRRAARYDLLANHLFWNSLGLDQCVHHLTHYLIIWLLLQHG